MKVGVVSGILTIVILSIAVGVIPTSSAQLSEAERLAGSSSDTGNLQVLEKLDSEVVLPNDTFNYFLKRASENIKLTFEFNEEKKADLHLKIAEERKREIRISEERGIVIPDNVVREQRENVEQADRIIKKLESEPAPDPALRRSIIERINNAFDQAEVSEIRKDFQKVRNEDDPVVKQQLATKLDDRLNKRTDVRVACFGGIDTLSIATSSKPVEKIRENCPVLKVFPQEEIRKAMEVRDGS